MGAVNVLISMAGEGAVLLDEKGEFMKALRRRERLSILLVPGIPWLPDFLPDIWKQGIMKGLFAWALLQEAPVPFRKVWQHGKKRKLCRKKPLEERSKGHENCSAVESGQYIVEGPGFRKKAVIDRMVGLMEKGGHLRDAEGYKKAVFERESQGTTGIGEGLRFPMPRRRL